MIQHEEQARPHADAAPSERFLALGRLRRRDLENLLLRGQPPRLDDLVGWEFRGMNTPAWSRALGIQKFVKGFVRSAQDPDEAYGYNCPVVQDGVTRPWRTLPSDAHPRRFGFYRVSTVDPTARDNAYLHALLIDYSRGGNAPMDPVRGLRDYLVQVEYDPAIYVGKAYYALGQARVPVSFFVLERLRPAPGPHASRS